MASQAYKLCKWTKYLVRTIGKSWPDAEEAGHGVQHSFITGGKQN